MEDHSVQGVTSDDFFAVYWRMRQLGIHEVAKECSLFIDVPKLDNVGAISRLSQLGILMAQRYSQIWENDYCSCP
jgi:hypothetical protein